jgi:hypothetical protein
MVWINAMETVLLALYFVLMATTESVEKPEEIEETVIEETSEVETWYGKDYAVFDRTLSLFSATPVRSRTFQMVINHRTNQAFTEDAFQSFLGFDGGGLRVGLGLRYGIFDFLDVGMYRLNSNPGQDVYEFDLRGQFLNEKKHHINMALRSGVTWFSQKNVQDAVGGFAQLLASKLLWHRLQLTGGLLYHSNSTGDGIFNGKRKITSDFDWSMAASGGFEIRLTDLVALTWETTVPFAGYRGDMPAMAGGVKLITNRHTFAIVTSNYPLMSSDGVVAGTHRDKQWVIGFNITREIGI